MIGFRRLQWKPLWLDSLGAKSFSVLITTPDIKIVIDPGIAVMHPSFPATDEDKARWANQGWQIIDNATKKADAIVVSHYHYDHFDSSPSLYKGKRLFIKNPNEYINDSQRERAKRLFDKLYGVFGNARLQDVLRPPEEKTYPDPLEDLPLAANKDYGDYNTRKKELFSKGKQWFQNRVKRWNHNSRIPELSFDDLNVTFPEAQSFAFGNTMIRFTKPLFHGIEYARVGWVIATIVEFGGEKLIHTSDLQGPYIEDYTEWIIQENPDVLMLDGPSTYLIPYMMNLINLTRVNDNVCRILRETDTNLIIFDHHLLRDVHYQKRVRPVYDTAARLDKQVITAAEYLGKTPIVLQ